MSSRFTETEKWDDKWFRSLPPLSKLVFQFICDRCDLAGFYEIDLEDMAFRIKAESNDLRGAVKGLSRGYLAPSEDIYDGTVIWVKNFLHYQKNLPLNPENNAHKHIIRKIAIRLDIFKSVKAQILEKLGAKEPLFRGTGIGKGKVKVEEGDARGRNFKPPTPQEVEAYGKEVGFEIDGEEFCAHYEANGWMRGKTKLKKWKPCVVTWMKSDKKRAAAQPSPSRKYKELN